MIRHFLPKSLFLLVLMLAAAAARAASSPPTQPDLRTLSSSDSGVELLVRFDPATRGQDERGAWRARVRGGDDPAGRLQLQVALPPQARPQVTALPVENSSTAGPLAGVEFSGANPAPLLDWNETTHGDLRLLEIRLEPLRGNGARADWCSAVQLRVDFGTSAGSGAPSRFSPDELAALVVNPAQASQWALPRLAARGALSDWDGDQWLRIPVDEEGIYQITPGLLSQQGVDPSGVDPATLKLFGYGGALIPESIAQPRNSRYEPTQYPLVREHDGDGAFEAGERLIFYGRPAAALGPLDNGAIGLRDHHYADVNYYWLLLGGNEAGLSVPALQDTTGGVPFTLSNVRWRGLVNEAKNYGTTSGKACFGDVFSQGTSATYRMPAPLPGVATPIRLEYDFYPESTMPSTYLSFTLGGQVYPEQGLPHSTRLEEEMTLAGDELALRVERLSSTGAAIYLNWFCPSFEAPARFVDHQISFELPATIGSYEVALSNPPASFYLFDVTDHDSLRVTRSSVVRDWVRRLAGGTGGRARRYVGADESGIRTPQGVALAEMPELKSQAGTARMIVIAPAAFAEAAQELVDYRNEDGRVSARLAVLEDIYAEFNGGVPDPGAIRLFLRHEWTTAQDPAEFVLLAGNGHYDYRGLLAGAHPQRVPAWHVDYTSSSANSWMIDDWFVKLENNNLVSMAIGRLPANEASEVRAYLRKLRLYEAAENLGEWRNRMLFVADDEHGANGVVSGMERDHSGDTEQLIQNRVPESFEVERLYLFNFPTVYNPALRIPERPQAEARLVEALNEGVAFVNFVGHGNNTTWTHEYIFNASRHLPLLQANNRPAIFFAATCSWAEIDLPVGEAFPQQLVNMEDGGAIAVLAATRKTGSNSNYIFANTVLNNLFDRDAEDGWPTIGEGFKDSKNNNPSDTNRRCYVVLGDPSLVPGFPRDGGSLTDLARAGQPADTLYSQALAGFSLVVDSLAADAAQSGVCAVSVETPQVMRSYTYDQNADDDNVYTLEYLQAGQLVYAGSATLEDGRASCRLMLPPEVAEGGQSDVLRAYFQGVDADGARRDGVIHAALPVVANPAPVADSDAPTLRLWLNGRNWREDDWVAPNSTVLLEIQDSSGVNLTRELGHRIELEIDGGMPEDLTQTFEYLLDDWTRGEARLALPRLDAGRHHLRARASDSFNNVGVAEAEFQVLEPGTARLADVVNFPNPAGESTRFTFRLEGPSQDPPADCELQVFTVKGRRVAHGRLALSGGSDFLWSEDWEPRNDHGERLARGVYLYRIKVKVPALSYSLLDEDGQYIVRQQKAGTLEATGKLIVD